MFPLISTLFQNPTWDTFSHHISLVLSICDSVSAFASTLWPWYWRILIRNFVEYLQHLLPGILIKQRVVSSSHFQYSFINYRKIKRRCRRNKRREVYLESSINKTSSFRCTRQLSLKTWGSKRENDRRKCTTFMLFLSSPTTHSRVYLEILGISGAGRQHQKKKQRKKKQQNF